VVVPQLSVMRETSSPSKVTSTVCFSILSSTSGDGSCDRCRGLLVTVVDAVTGEHHSATWNGGAISEEEAVERRAEARCSRCGRELDPASVPVIRLGYDG
jgi:hypothetical protein